MDQWKKIITDFDSFDYIFYDGSWFCQKQGKESDPFINGLILENNPNRKFQSFEQSPVVEKLIWF